MTDPYLYETEGIEACGIAIILADGTLRVEMRRKGLSPAPTGVPVTFVVLAAVP